MQDIVKMLESINIDKNTAISAASVLALLAISWAYKRIKAHFFGEQVLSEIAQPIANLLQDSSLEGKWKIQAYEDDPSASYIYLDADGQYVKIFNKCLLLNGDDVYKSLTKYDVKTIRKLADKLITKMSADAKAAREARVRLAAQTLADKVKAIGTKRA